MIRPLTWGPSPPSCNGHVRSFPPIHFSMALDTLWFGRSTLFRVLGSDGVDERQERKNPRFLGPQTHVSEEERL